MTHNEHIISIDDLACYTTKEEKQRYRSKILNKTFLFTRSKVTEYIDMSTGEIISPALAKRLGVVEYNFGIFVKERNEILNSFRKEVFDFAQFILLFRNKRRGISPNIKQVIEYYSKYSSKRIDNIKNRLLPQVMNKIIASDTLLMPPFQLTSRTMTAQEHLQEDFVAENVFLSLMRRRSSAVEIEK